MAIEKAEFLKEVENYYTEKINTHGLTAKGVDWNGSQSQLLRFEQLIRLCPTHDGFSINDLGCGYGAFYEFMSEKFPLFSYYGVDVSPAMIEAAKQKHGNHNHISFSIGNAPSILADYTVASGIFNVRLDCSSSVWSKYIEDTLGVMNRFCRLGFSFNCLTSYSDSDKMKPYLHYADPNRLFDFCKRNFSRNVSLLHDYELYEFTILVKK